MLYRLLLVDGQGEGRAARLDIRTLREVPGPAQCVSVHFRPVRNDRLFESARFAGELAYGILLGEGIVRAQLWVEYEVASEAVNVTGRSGDLLFALALITATWTRSSHEAVTLAATGVLARDGAVQRVEHPLAKIRAAVDALAEAGPEALVFYPAGDEAEIEAWRSQHPPPAHVRLQPVAHVDEAINCLGYVLEKVCLRNPFRGLEHFDYEHHAVFFGRDTEVRELAEQLLRREAAGAPGVMVEGPSGSGKSSLLRAGILPALVDPRHLPDAVRMQLGMRPVSAEVRLTVWRPGKLPPGCDECTMCRSIEECWATFTDIPTHCRNPGAAAFDALAAWRRKHWPVAQRFVWLIDQFEEILALGLPGELLDSFGGFLEALQADGAWVLVCVRADAMPAIKEHASLRRVFGVNEGLYYLTPLTGAALGDVIERPARAAALTYGTTPDGRPLDQLLLQEAQQEPGRLPVLQFTLNELYLKRSGNELTYAAYAQMGGLAGSIASTAAAVLGSESGPAQAVRVRLFRSLVSVNDSGQAVRRYAPLAEIASDAQQMTLVERLVATRLCVTDEHDGRAVVAFAHDSLLNTLPPLTDWLKDEGSLLKSRELAQRDARLWQEHGRRNAWLATSDKLAAYKALGAAGLVLQDAVSEFIQSSEEHARRATRIRRTAASLIALLAIGASLAAWFASGKQHEAGERAAEALKARAKLMTQVAAQRLKDGDTHTSRGIILEVLADSAPSPDAAAVNVFQELRATDPAAAIMAGHTRELGQVAYSPDGVRIVTSSYDNTVRIWDGRTGVEITTLAGHSRGVSSVAYSRDGARIVSASLDGSARVWDARSGAQLLVVRESGELQWCDFSPDGTRIVIGVGKLAEVRDARSGALLETLSGHTDAVAFVAYSHDGSRIVTASADRTARIWDARTGAELMRLSGHDDIVTSAAFSADGRRIVTSSFDQTARVWDARTGTLLFAVSPHLGQARFAAYSPDGATLTVAFTDKTARVFDAATGAQILVLSGHVGVVAAVAYSPDSSHVVTASFDGTARTWELHPGQKALALGGHADHVNSVEYSPDSAQVVTASDDGTARIWDARNGREVAVLAGHREAVYTAAFSPDGKRIVTASDSSMRIWNRTGGDAVLVITSHERFHSAAFSPDGGRIVAAQSPSVSVWNALSGETIGIAAGHSDDVHTAVYSPDGTRLLSASDDRTARIWDSLTLRQLKVLTHTDYVNDAGYSPDGRQVVTAEDDHTGRVWDAQSGAPLRALVGHNSSVHGARFSPDGSRIVTASFDGTARIWEAGTGIELAVLPGHSEGVVWATFSPDGAHVATASRDRTVRIWDAAVPANLSGQILWERAAEADPLAANVRTQLGLTLAGPQPPPGRAVQRTASRTDAARCDETAGAYYDPERRAPGMDASSINADLGLAACEGFLSVAHPEARQIYQAGRALAAHRDFARAKRAFERAVAEGYVAARVDLAQLLTDPAANLLDPVRAVSQYEGAARDKLPLAAYELGRLYELGIPGAEALQPALARDPDRAWHWYRYAADRGEPGALARFAQLDENRAMAAGPGASQNALLLDAFRLYALAANRAAAENWPDTVWRCWRYRRATLARLLAREGMMQQVADTYARVIGQDRGR